MIDKEKIFNTLIEQGRAEDLFKLARFMYKVGEPLIPDYLYDEFERGLKETELSYLTEKSYDDDDIPEDVLKEFGLNYLSYTPTRISKYCEYLDSDKSMSIKALYSYDEAWTFFKAVKGLRLHASVKCDGVNTKHAFDKGAYKCTMTRGRATNAIDVTPNASRKLENLTIDKEGLTRLYAECFVSEDKFREIPRPSGETFTSGRMAGISLLRVNPGDEWYKHLRFLFFGAEGLRPTIHETFDYLESKGFEVPPRMIIEPGDVPDNYDEFCVWLKEKVFDTLHKEQVDRNIPADGVVIDVDDYNYVGDVTNQYSSRNAALKFEHWSGLLYTGKVRRIVIEQQEVNASCVAEIEPFITEDNATVTRVSCYNPSILVENNITIGSEISFVRNSGAISVIVYGEELAKLKGRTTKLGSSKLSNFS